MYASLYFRRVIFPYKVVLDMIAAFTIARASKMDLTVRCSTLSTLYLCLFLLDFYHFVGMAKLVNMASRLMLGKAAIKTQGLVGLYNNVHQRV